MERPEALEEVIPVCQENTHTSNKSAVQRYQAETQSPSRILKIPSVHSQEQELFLVLSLETRNSIHVSGTLPLCDCCILVAGGSSRYDFDAGKGSSGLQQVYQLNCGKHK